MKNLFIFTFFDVILMQAEIILMREKYEQEIQNLELELEKMKLSEFTETVRRNNISPERIIDSNPESNHSRVMGISLIEREECEVNSKP